VAGPGIADPDRDTTTTKPSASRPTTQERLVEAGYDVRFGRRLFMEEGETVVTDDSAALADRDYSTIAHAEKRG
jgi:precorrin-2/cobalt-factor-2 C20-methyltransferase